MKKKNFISDAVKYGLDQKQSNNLTYSEYDASERQENILTLICEQLQPLTTNKQACITDMSKIISLKLICDRIGGRNNKKVIIDEIEKMKSLQFSFKWIDINIHKTIKSHGYIVITSHDIKGTNNVILDINPWAIPFIIYYGKQIGGTFFSTSIALKLRGRYTKRLYKIICGNRNNGFYFCTLEQLRKDFHIPQNYSNHDICKKILTPSEERIKESLSDIYFTYKLWCKERIMGCKPKSDTLHIYIIKRKDDQQDNKISFIYTWIKNVLSKESDSNLKEIIDRIVKNGHLLYLYNKCIYYDRLVKNRKITEQHALNCFSKLLHEDLLFLA